MKNKNAKSLCRLLSAVTVLFTLLSVLTSCLSFNDETKDDILENINNTIENNEVEYDYVFQYLVYWGMPEFDKEKFAWAEQVFATYYNYAGGLPDTLEHAVLTAELFFEEHYDNIDLDDAEAVTHSMLDSYVDAVGDPYSVYRPPEDFSQYDTEMSGQFGGIGVVIEYDHQNETLMISSINIDSPAEAAGFRVGDFIWAVDGVEISEIGYLNAVYKVRGEIGTQVTITVKRGEELIDITVTRALVEEKTVGYEITEEGFGYIQVTDFKANTYTQFVEAIEYMEDSNVSGIIFDMRSNPGGYLTTVCDMLSYLIPNGQIIVSYEYKTGYYKEIKSQNDLSKTDDPESEPLDHVVDLPMVVICNEYTASAGEIFTAAIRDYRNEELLEAAIVGTTTYKKGIMQSTFIYSEEDTSSVTLTIAYYNPPCGENYHGIGVTPDVSIQNTETEDLQYSTAVNELKKLVEAN